MAPTMPMVSALLAACDGLDLVSPIAVPAALRIAVSSVAMPTATSQPKNAEPQLRPPYSSRWMAAGSRAGARGGGGSRVVPAHAVGGGLARRRLRRGAAGGSAGHHSLRSDGWTSV